MKISDHIDICIIKHISLNISLNTWNIMSYHIRYTTPTINWPSPSRTLISTSTSTIICVTIPNPFILKLIVFGVIFLVWATAWIFYPTSLWIGNLSCCRLRTKWKWLDARNMCYEFFLYTQYTLHRYLLHTIKYALSIKTYWSIPRAILIWIAI